MGITYTGLINGNINPIDLVKLIQNNYGGDDFSIHFTSMEGMYQISFTENLSEEQRKLRPWERTKVKRKRLMSVYVDGACACDYQDVTDAPMTLVSLGHSGDCREVIDSLIMSQNGYVKDELGPEDYQDRWVRLNKELIVAREEFWAKHGLNS